MNMYEIMEALREDVEVPDIVQKKADEALEQIRRACGEEPGGAPPRGRGRKMSKKGRRKLAICIAAAVLVVGGTCIAAAYRGISHSTEKDMKISAEQKAEFESQAAEEEAVKAEGEKAGERPQAENDTLVTFPEVSATDKGVTITLQDCIVDNYNARLTFRIDGYKLPQIPEDAAFYQPEAFFDIKVDGEWPRGSMSMGFYDGSYVGDDLEYVKDESVQNCQFADGSMEYTIRFACHEKGLYMNKPVRVEFTGIGYTVEKAGDAYTDLEGSWALEWTLQGCDDIYEADVENGAIGDTGAALTHVELSPISAKVLVDFPKQEVEEELEGGGSHTTWVEPSDLTGVKLKDGTVYHYAWMGGGGSSGYRGEDTLEMVRYGSRVIDIDQVEYLLFYKDYPEDGNVTDDNFWFVKIR